MAIATVLQVARGHAVTTFSLAFRCQRKAFLGVTVCLLSALVDVKAERALISQLSAVMLLISAVSASPA